MATIYTIGYASKPISTFIQQLQHYHIDVIADVRSVPYSKVFFDYHKEAISKTLEKHAIKYVYLGDELGPRSKESAHYNADGQVQFERLMNSALFQSGITRLKTGIQREYNIALMCAEKDPATCHRSLLIGYYLARLNMSSDLNNWTIKHITHTGELEVQADLEQRICSMHNTGSDLFLSECELKKQSYEIQLKKTSYKKPLLSR